MGLTLSVDNDRAVQEQEWYHDAALASLPPSTPRVSLLRVSCLFVFCDFIRCVSVGVFACVFLGVSMCGASLCVRVCVSLFWFLFV